MRLFSGGCCALTTLVFLLAASPAVADPCGMVPPITPGGDNGLPSPIVRVGPQKTYVFYKNGWETIVLRPGFSGKVDQFGMLIPFPTPPVVRKVPDSIFEHIAAAIDPPEFIVNFGHPTGVSRASFGGGGLGNRSGPSGLTMHLSVDEVQVVSQQAIGIYEVAVLRSGSTQSLKRWLEQHNYRYPSGMDQSCDEYVKQRWSFVAVKSQIGRKSAVEPKPGQRSVDARLPRGATFDGHVQAMGFRFRTPRLVVPMRLSAFNRGKLRNVVYLLSDRPARIAQLSPKYVVRQISGEKLYANLTKRLPLRIVGGRYSDMSPLEWKKLDSQRSSAPYVEAARDLFASDLLCAATGRSSFAHEQSADRLRLISGTLGLRGRSVDKAVTQLVKQQQYAVTQRALKGLRGMTLTVLDGEFPREIIAQHNLTFVAYRMPKKQNHSGAYDARYLGKPPERQGYLRVGALGEASDGETVVTTQTPPVDDNALVDENALAEENAAADLSPPRRSQPLLLIAATLAIGLLLVRRRGRRTGKRLLIVLTGCLVVLGSIERIATSAPLTTLIRQFGSPKTSAAVDEIVKLGDQAVDPLATVALNRGNLEKRGWAIVCLGRIRGEKAEACLTQLHSDTTRIPLVRMWAAAALVNAADSLREVVDLWPIAKEFPGTQANWQEQFMQYLSPQGKTLTAKLLIEKSLSDPELAKLLAPLVLRRGADEMLQVMLHDESNQIRRQATAYVATMELKSGDDVTEAVLDALRFHADAKQIPWHGGALFIPGLRWKRNTAREIVCELIAWHVWCDTKPAAVEAHAQIDNALASQLITIAKLKERGSRLPGTAGWLKIWKDTFGSGELRRLLAVQNAEQRYADVLAGPKAEKK